MSRQKTTYAQSSDIKARTFREYRRDMKKKAIAELEFMPFLQELLSPARVGKHGADAQLWFLQRSGKITQEPDYMAVWPDGRQFLYEFQYAENTDGLAFFDFKVSKVGKKSKGVRTPHSDREFFYVVKPNARYAFVSPAWIMENGKEGPVPAWGSRPAYRVPVDRFHSILKSGGAQAKQVIASVDGKNSILAFQDRFPYMEAQAFSAELQSAVDKRQLIKIMPSNLDGFFRVCFLLERMDETPQNAAVWLVYLASFFRHGMPALDFARWMFCLDFLYFKCAELADNERQTVSQALDNAEREIQGRFNDDGSFGNDPNASITEQTRCFLFATNLLEDILQDFHVHHNGTKRITRIFQTLPDCPKTANFIISLHDDALD